MKSSDMYRGYPRHLGHILLLILLFVDLTGAYKVTLTAEPKFFSPESTFTLNCRMTGDPGLTDNIQGIIIGKEENREINIAGIFYTGETKVLDRLQIRVSAQGELNNSSFLSSYLSVNVTNSTCADRGLYFCRLLVQRGLIVISDKGTLNYDLHGVYLNGTQTNPCDPIVPETTTPATRSAARGTSWFSSVLLKTCCLMSFLMAQIWVV